jgi:unsaturated rhamnogalacturonyl hydrolase
MRQEQAAEQPIVADRPWSVRMADSVIARHSQASARWHYEHGLMLKAIEQVWHTTGAAGYWQFVKDTVDLFIDPAGQIKTYRLEEYNLDQINPGKLLFSLYRATGDRRYKNAIVLLRRQLAEQPRTHSGGFWHKQIYPFQIWLDGLYMAGPFYAEYAATFNEPNGFDDVAHEISLVEAHMRDPQTGLLYHGWDESKQQRWADPISGCSPHFWGRAIGWYAMALVDVLDFLPLDHPQRPTIVASLARLVDAIALFQEPSSGLWYQILDQGQREGNYLEASAACMFVYAIAKAVRKAYLADDYLRIAQHAYQGIVQQLIRVDQQGLVNLERTCSVAGLGGDPYRDGSYAYYVGEPVATNDYKGVGTFILAAVEIEAALITQVQT